MGIEQATDKGIVKVDTQKSETAANLREDMYGFHQGEAAVKPGSPEKKPPGSSDTAKDPYDYHQGPGDGKPGSDRPPVDVSKLPQTAKLETTLYDIAAKSVRDRAKLTNEKVNKDAIYHELNRIMVLNGYEKSNLEGRTNLNDHMLKRQWNNVRKGQEFRLYGDAEAPRNKNGEKPKPEGEKQKPEGEKPAPKPPKEGEGKQKPEKDTKPPKLEKAPQERQNLVDPRAGDRPAQGADQAPRVTDRAPQGGDRAPKAADQAQQMPTREQFKAMVTQEIERRTTLPPMEQGQTYSQLIKKHNPEWKDDQVFAEAKRLKDINGEPNGRPVQLMSKPERESAVNEAMARYEAISKQKAEAERAEVEKAAQTKAAAERQAQEQAQKQAADKQAAEKQAAEKQAAEQRRLQKAQQQSADKTVKPANEKFVVEAP